MDRRQYLKGIVSVFSIAGVALYSIPFIRSLKIGPWRAGDFDLEIDTSNLTPDKPIITEWFGTPITIIRRTSAEIEELAASNEGLLDPYSESSQQPTEAQNIYRSIKPDVLVYVPLCTHLGCKVSKIAKGDPSMSLRKNWPGGFNCPCHGSDFDMAGRVYKNMPAPLNLAIPPHKYTSEHKILLSLKLIT